MSKKKDPWVSFYYTRDVASTFELLYRSDTQEFREVKRFDDASLGTSENTYSEYELTPALQDAFDVAFPDEGGDYRTICPSCGGPIHLVQFTGFTSIPIEKDGWSYGEESIDSEGEIFKCSGDCGKYVPSSYVFKSMSKESAKKKMEAICKKK
jgi:hypothetical protein